MGDPVQEYLDTGGTSVNPIDASNDSTIPAGSRQLGSTDPVQAYLDSGGKTRHPVEAAPSAKQTPKNGDDLPHDGVAVNPDYNDSGLGGIALHGVSAVGSSIIGGWRGLSELVQGHGFDAAADAVREEQENRTFHPEAGSDADKAVNALGSNYNPLTWIPKGAKRAGDLTLNVTGSPALATGVETGLNALPMLAGMRGAGAAEAESAGIPSAPEPAPISAPKASAPGTPLSELIATGAPRVLPKSAPEAIAPKLSATDIPRTAPEAAPASPPSQPLTASGSARSGYWEPPTDTAAPVFQKDAPVAEPGSLLSKAEQANRQAILERVGLPEARVSAIEGNAPAASNEYQESGLNSPSGIRMKSVIDNERTALANHADQITQDTGGTAGSAADETTRLERGNNILEPLDNLKSYFDTATKALYDEANERAAGQRVAFPKFQGVLSDDSELTNSDRVHLVNGVNSYLKNLNMAKDPASTTSTIGGDVAQAETVRKYLNENWSPQNSKLVGKLKDALDDDVTQSAGSDVYAQARQMRTLRGATLDDPNGISKIMDSSGPQGVNRAVPVEKVADAITTMPVAQLGHVINTLKNLPPELAEQGDAALAEIKAHMASKVADAGKSTKGGWSDKAVNTVLTKNSAKMNMLFTPEEMAKFGDLNDAGNILKKDQRYPGAAAQAHNLLRSGAMGAITTGTTGLGHLASGLTGIPGGEIAGAWAGSKLAGKYSDAAAMRNVESRIRKLNPQ
jgi:hypothetical protein